MIILAAVVVGAFLLSLVRGVTRGWRRIDRVRGSGWLHCPHCDEDAQQDVVDEMKFAALLLRYTPVSRRRVLKCRRCDYVRPATDAEMSKLETAGRPIARAWMAPVGLVSILLAIFVVHIAIFASGDTVVVGGITLVTHPVEGDASNPQFQQIAGHLSFEAPSSWDPRANIGFTPPEYIATDNSGQNLGEYILRDPTTSTLQALTDTYYNLKGGGLQNPNFPKLPPKGQCTKVGDQPAYSLVINYTANEQPAVVLLWSVVHDGVGYVFIFTGQSTEGIKIISDMAKHVMETVKFVSDEPKPSFTPSPSASPSASPSPAASASPSAGPSLAPGQTAAPTATPSPSAPAITC